ncbi:MAG: stalk domain-containing protein [Fimbriimonas sp.]|nr:stalk domain-containing protein [Fimbriimonas sp.]
MANLRTLSVTMGLVVFTVLPAIALADIITLKRDNVIPVVLEDKLSISGTKVGDIFTVRVADDGPLPKGTEMLGRVDRIIPARGKRPSSMDLKFTKILMPDNSRVSIDAAAIPLDDRYVTRNGDGRLVAKQDFRKQQLDVLGGAIGGFIVGSILHRRVAGTVIGTIVGVAAAENEKTSDNNNIANPGDKLGALINDRQVIVQWGDAPSREEVNSHLDRGMNLPDRIPHAEAKGHDSGQNTLFFKDNDIHFPTDARPYWIGDTFMVPLQPVATQLGLDVDRRPDNTIYVDGKDDHLKLNEHSRRARLNDEDISLPRTVVEHNGVIYAPLDALVLLVKDPVVLNGTKYLSKA